MYKANYRPVVLLAIAAVLQAACGPAPDTAAAYSDSDSLHVPAAPGSQSPHLASGPDDILALSWLEPDGDGHSLRYSVLQAATWSAPRAVASGDNWFVNWADFPSVVPVSNSLWAAHWLVRQPAGGYAYDVHFTISTNGGETWSDPVLPHNDGTPTEHGFVTIFRRPTGIGLIWLDGRNMAHETPAADHSTQGMTLRSATYSSELAIADEAVVDGLVCDCCQTDVAITDEGPVAVYRDRTPDETRDIYITRLIDGKWQPGHPVADDGWSIGGCPVNGPVIEADGDEVSVAWFTAANDESKVRIAHSSDYGQTFSAPVDVAVTDTYGRVGLAMLGGGDVAVSWLCKPSADRAQVCLRRVTANNAVGPLLVLSGEQEVSPLNVPQLARSGGYLIAAWTVQDVDRQSIASRRLLIESLP